MVQILHQRYPEKRLFASGFSLGGNVILKYLGEQSDQIHAYNFKGAAVTCVPFDPAASHHKLDVGFNRMVYSAVRISRASSLLCLLFLYVEFLSNNDPQSRSPTQTIPRCL
jgi:predicted alpha/beta-fold hydrolase